MPRVFISSTSSDLERYRREVRKGIDGMPNCSAFTMDNFLPRGDPPLERCRRAVGECDIFVGIIGHYYGETPPDETRSFTELEYDEAGRLDKPRLMFLTNPDFPTPARLREPDNKFSSQQNFRRRIERGTDVAYFGPNVYELIALVKAAVADVLPPPTPPPPLPPPPPPPPAPPPPSAPPPSPPSPRTLPPRLRKPPPLPWRRLVLGVAGIVAALSIVTLLIQHIYVAFHRYGSDQVVLPATVFHPAFVTSPLLTLMRKYRDEGNLDFLIQEPPATQSLPAFFIDRTDVTNAAFTPFVHTQAGLTPPRYWNNSKFNEPNQPVVGVDWHTADAYCRWRGARLPSGDEWERGARGTDGRLYPWGNSFDPGDANVGEGPLRATSSVGASVRDRSVDGVSDVAGNVREWTAEERPLGDNNTGRVIRGASWKVSGEIYGLTFLRIVADPTIKSNDIGFRCAMDAGQLRSMPDMVFIDQGSFLKGSENNPLLNLARKFHMDSTAIRRLIEVRPQPIPMAEFGLDRTGVTNAQYGEFLASSDATSADRSAAGGGEHDYRPKAEIADDPRFDGPQQPVVGVDWYGANAYCRWRGRRLPSSEEWERAAAGPDDRNYPWGASFDPDRCNTADSVGRLRKTADVGTFPRCTTSEGILDLVGNADEWTSGDASVGDNTRKILRGGSWAEPGEIRGFSQFDVLADAGYRGPDVGFRCAADPARSWIEKLLQRLR